MAFSRTHSIDPHESDWKLSEMRVNGTQVELARTTPDGLELLSRHVRERRSISRTREKQSQGAKRAGSLSLSLSQRASRERGSKRIRSPAKKNPRWESIWVSQKGCKEGKGLSLSLSPCEKALLRRAFKIQIPRYVSQAGRDGARAVGRAGSVGRRAQVRGRRVRLLALRCERDRAGALPAPGQVSSRPAPPPPSFAFCDGWQESSLSRRRVVSFGGCLTPKQVPLSRQALGPWRGALRTRGRRPRPDSQRERHERSDLAEVSIWSQRECTGDESRGFLCDDRECFGKPT